MRHNLSNSKVTPSSWANFKNNVNLIKIFKFKTKSATYTFKKSGSGSTSRFLVQDNNVKLSIVKGANERGV